MVSLGKTLAVWQVTAGNELINKEAFGLWIPYIFTIFDVIFVQHKNRKMLLQNFAMS